MKIKTNDGDMNVAGQGQGIFNSVGAGLGIASFLGMGANNGCGNNNGFLGGLFGNNNCGGCPVNQKELAYAIELATAREEDAKIFNEARRNDEKIAGVVKEVTDGLIKVGVAVAENSKELGCLKVKVENNREAAKAYTDSEVRHEAQLRKAADENLASWTTAELCKKIDGKLTINGDDICWHKCHPVLEQCSCGSETNPFNIKVVTDAVMAALNAKK